MSNYVKCIGILDERESAWNTSRPDSAKSNLNFEDVKNMDISLNSMAVYTIEMRSSVFFRDLLFSVRPIAPWSMSIRSFPINENTLYLADEFKGNEHDESCIKNMLSALEEGKTRDQSRGMLPLSVSGVYTFNIDFRSLMSFCKTIEKLSPFLFDLYCAPMLIACNLEYAYNATSIKAGEQYYKIANIERINGIQKFGNMIFGHYKMKTALASQFLRQHYSKVKIGLWDLIGSYQEGGRTQNDMIDVVFYADANAYEKLMSIRSHWVLDWNDDMWGSISGDYVRGMTAEEFWEFLPNGAGKKDPYWAEVYSRVLGTDPGIPCPLMCEWPALIDERAKEMSRDNIVLNKYKELVREGFIKDNPNNEHRVKYHEIREAK